VVERGIEDYLGLQFLYLFGLLAGQGVALNMLLVGFWRGLNIFVRDA
jgi:hypothetical protein